MGRLSCPCAMFPTTTRRVGAPLTLSQVRGTTRDIPTPHGKGESEHHYVTHASGLQAWGRAGGNRTAPEQRARPRRRQGGLLGSRGQPGWRGRGGAGGPGAKDRAPSGQVQEEQCPSGAAESRVPGRGIGTQQQRRGKSSLGLGMSSAFRLPHDRDPLSPSLSRSSPKGRTLSGPVGRQEDRGICVDTACALPAGSSLVRL